VAWLAVVKAVSVIDQDDIGRLRVSTYVSDTGDVEQTNQFMLTYPKLKQALTRDMTGNFRELDFFSQIPHTCERLQEKNYAGR
jgi:hypothetical protein